MMPNIPPEITTPIVTVMALIAVDLLKWLRSKTQNLAVDRVAINSAEVRVLLAELGVKLGADRAYVGKYHNGDHFSDGSEITRESRTHEWVAPSVDYESELYQHLLLTRVPEEGRLVYDAVCYKKTADIGDGEFRSKLEIGNIKAVARCALKESPSAKLPFGFIGLDFIRHSEKPDDVDRIIQMYAWRIAAVLKRSK